MAGRGVSGFVAGGLLFCLLICGAPQMAAAADPPQPPPLKKVFGPNGTEATDFTLAGASAVDELTHTFYVADKGAGKLYKFASDGTALDFTSTESYIEDNAITGLSMPAGSWETQVAVNSTSHVVYVTSGNAVKAFNANGDPANFTAGPGIGTNEIGGFGELIGVAVDADGNIYASDYFGVIKIYSPAGAFITQIETETPSYVAVGPDGTVYVVRYDGPLIAFEPSTVTVGPTTVFTEIGEPLPSIKVRALTVDPVSGNLLVLEIAEGGVGQAAEYDSSGALIFTFGGPGEEGELKGGNEGISVDGSTGAVLISTNDFNGGTFAKVELFEPEGVTVGPPTVVSTSSAGVSSSTAFLHGVIDANALETTYYFEYGLSDCSTPGAGCLPAAATPTPIGSAQGIAVSQQIGGLLPNTTYHFRIIAENGEGVTKGPDRTFTTQVADLDFQLPDARAWEMVSPPAKSGGALIASSKGIIQAAESGNGLAYQSLNPIELDPDGNRAIEPSAVLARRDGNGWHSEDISPPRTRATNIANSPEFNLFSTELSRALLEPRDATPLSEASSERSPYLRENTDPPNYIPLVTSKPGFANVPAGTVFGGPEPDSPVSKVSISGASPDLTHVVVSSDVPLVAGGDPNSLYEWVGGDLQPVSVLPPGEGGGIVQGTLGSSLVSVRNAVSDDGSRVFWGRGNVGTSGINLSSLYVRDTAAGQTGRLDSPKGGSGSGTARPAFQGASRNGDTVFFTDSRALTADASASGRDLYRCEIEAGTPGCSTLTDISTATDPTESADVQGVVPAIADDGSRIYFVAKGVLDEAANEMGESAVPGDFNLYLWEAGEGPRFIVGLSADDDRAWGKVEGETPGYTQNLSAAGSPSGRYFAFMSSLDLTGVRNEGTEPVEQVFGFDAETNRIVCASCPPTGVEPTGQLSPPTAIDLQHVWTDRQVAAALPAMALSGGEQVQPYPLHPPRSVHDNGRIFFHAIDPLAPADSNGAWDVYEYEPSGTGDCAGASRGTAIVRSGDACVSLISAGSTQGDSSFLDASLSGDDVFFLSKARLSVTDEDEVGDVYDARVNGVVAVRNTAAACTGDSCQPSSPPPGLPMVASQGFLGKGNVHPRRHRHCPKGKRKVRRAGKVRCLPRKRFRHHRAAHHATRTNGAGR